MRRLIMAAVLAGGIAVPVFGLASSSSATGTSSIQCAKLVGSVSGTITISHCTPASKDNKTLSGNAANLALGGTLTWKKSGQTTIIENVVTTSPGQGGCPKKWTEEDTTADVSGGTSTYTHAGDAVTSHTCNKGSAIKLVKGTTAGF
jgi:hypothetical protein